MEPVKPYKFKCYCCGREFENIHYSHEVAITIGKELYGEFKDSDGVSICTYCGKEIMENMKKAEERFKNN